MNYIDTHCHLDFHAFDDDRAEMIERMTAAGVTRAIVPAISPDNWQVVVDLAKQFDPIWAAVGVHPNSAAHWQDSWLDSIRELAEYSKVVAIGEIGLDYYWDKTPKERQKQAFLTQMTLAHELGLPAIIHNRNSDDDMIMLLADCPQSGSDFPGVLHSFSGDWEMASTALDMGYYLGFTAPITYKNGEKMRSVAGRMPADRILLETDAPFLPPQNFRGKRNEPSYIPLIAQRLAAVRNCSVEQIACQTRANSIRLFARLNDAPITE